jgi:hypothetical protein
MTPLEINIFNTLQSIRSTGERFSFNDALLLVQQTIPETTANDLLVVLDTLAGIYTVSNDGITYTWL